MSLVVTCSACSTRLKAPAGAAGKSLKCPKCGNSVGVPAADEPAPVPPPLPTPPAWEVVPPPPPTPPAVAEDLPEDLPEELPAEKTKRKPRKKRDDDQEEEESKSQKRPKPATIAIAVGGGVAVLGCLIISGVVAIYAFSGSKPAAETDRRGVSDADNPKPAAEDLDVYTSALSAKVSFDIKQFTASGMKAETYVKDEPRGMFRELVIRVDPVYLTDKLTGKSALYTRAKFTRNNPAPPRVNSMGGVTSFPEPYQWAKVEMLP